jgi:hypothetical protein
MRERRDKEIISTSSSTNLGWERNISASISRIKKKKATATYGATFK